MNRFACTVPFVDSSNKMQAFFDKPVTERQQLSIHTVEEGKVAKTFGNAAVLVPPPGK